MIQVKNHFIYNPGGENEGSTTPIDDKDKKDSDDDAAKPKEEKSIVKKIKDALQDWSNDDKRESDFDERSPIT
ncbi:hypothetical protein [Ferruginibacter sp.]|jgi:hypothetical protein|uniref:hypothetical protein n=1 Tax=Ferruginibacter sp. TaxID=1940288 RepID=UPI0026590B3E|nr:hypothetical protein [Ferruginibacter sp.]